MSYLGVSSFDTDITRFVVVVVVNPSKIIKFSKSRLLTQNVKRSDKDFIKGKKKTNERKLLFHQSNAIKESYNLFHSEEIAHHPHLPKCRKYDNSNKKTVKPN